MLKAIEIEFKTKKFLINKWVVLINRQTNEFITRILDKGLHKLYQQVQKAKKPDKNAQNMIHLISTIIECQKGGYNAIRQTIVRHCNDLISAEGNVLDKQQIIDLTKQNNSLEDISNWEN